jgi:hypothetical protein
VMEIVRRKIWKYAKSLDKMSKGDSLMVQILEKSRFFLLMMLLLDLTLFTYNGMSHQDMTLSQNSLSIQNYIFTNLVASLLVLEIMWMIHLNNIFNYSYFGSKTDLSSPLPSSSNEIKYESYYTFFKEGISAKKMNNLSSARYYNLIGILRLVMFELLYVGLQLFPTVQVLAIALIQGVMCIFTYYCGFKVKIFQGLLHKIQHILFETLMTIILIVFSFMCFQEEWQIRNSKFWQKVQISCIGLIIFVALSNVIITIIGLVVNIRKTLKSRDKDKNRRSKKLKTGKIYDEHEAGLSLRKDENDEAPRLSIAYKTKKKMKQARKRGSIQFQRTPLVVSGNKSKFKKNKKRAKKKNKGKKTDKKNRARVGSSDIHNNNKLADIGDSRSARHMKVGGSSGSDHDSVGLRILDDSKKSGGSGDREVKMSGFGENFYKGNVNGSDEILEEDSFEENFDFMAKEDKEYNDLFE